MVQEPRVSVEDEIGRKLTGSAPPPFRHLLVPEPQQKGKRRAPSDAGGHIFVGRTELGTVDGSMSGEEVQGIFYLFKLTFET